MDVFLDMAINRMPPFEEYQVTSKKTQVVGLQDAAILLSIIDHTKTAPENGRCALVSEDAVFHGAETRKVWEQAGVKLELQECARSVQ
jgi:hypothetical protein